MHLFPEITPYQQNWLPVSGGHKIYYEQSGNPKGIPVVVLHGGPGSGASPAQRRFFDPAHYRIVMLDQRGCCRSTPLAETRENTIAHLVADIEALRHHLHITEWLVFGGSWGSTLALAYAAEYPTVITGMILRGIFLCRQSEIDWFLYGTRQFFPEAWGQFTDGIPDRQNILTWYATQIESADTEIVFRAAQRFNRYEAAIMQLLPSAQTQPTNPVLICARARIQMHYLLNLGFLKQPLLTLIDRFRHIPATIIQGRYDMVCPPVSACELKSLWPAASLVMVPDAGHAVSEPGISTALLQAAAQFQASYTHA